MVRVRSWNPLAFLPWQVTILSSLIYIAIFAALLETHHHVPAAPSTPTPISGLNLTQAWLDLEFIADGYHPWGSRRNEVVRQYLLHRIETILQENKVSYKNVHGTDQGFVSEEEDPALVTVFTNDTSNFTSIDDWTYSPVTLYGESENIIVYIRGGEDPDGDWWNSTDKYDGSSGVLVNAHYDSVSSGMGATDDGVGVVTVLQIISHFTKKGNRPRRGLVALLNNGEENGLYGARSYVRHPISQLPHTFLNLEGAGAGGRAMLFRSTDTEVTKAYSKSPHPFGSVVSGDGFKRGFIRSGTDYSVFVGELGMRGLDVAFYEPRARYHTTQDDAANTNRNSVWHMLSGAVATLQQLTSHQGNDFEGSPDANGRLDTGKGSDSFYFDIFGRVFIVGRLNTLFALSVTLLVTGPIIFLLLEILLRKQEKWYLLAGKRYLKSSDDDEAVRIYGRRGFFRFPFAFTVASGICVMIAYLLTKFNPEIIYSSQYAVWAMFLCAWFSVAWLLLAGASNVRPTALQRSFCLIWLYALSWIFLVFTTVGEHQMHIASGYFFVLHNASTFAALLVEYLGFFALPKTSKYVATVLGAQAEAGSPRPVSRSSRQLLDHSDATDEGEPNERSSLLQGSRGDHSTFTKFNRRHRAADRDEIPDDTDEPLLTHAHPDEQAWSSSLPQWTWVIQFLILMPINVILLGQVALLLTSATNQTPADGNSVLPVYLILAGLTVLLLLPLAPFLHRFTYHVPTLLFLIFIGCTIYSLVAFPFSRNARMKYYFVQTMDLDSGVNNVTVQGLDGYVQRVIADMPSASGQPLNCGDPNLPQRKGLTSCSWHGLPPNVVPRGYITVPHNSSLKHAYRDWLDVNVTRDGASAAISLRGQNAKMCRITFDHAVSQVQVEDGATDPRQRPVGDAGSTVVRLFGRTWDKTFRVNVTWDETTTTTPQRGRVWCMWSDANTPGAIPAYDELHRFEPVWSVVSKSSDGLFEGFKGFEV